MAASAEDSDRVDVPISGMEESKFECFEQNEDLPEAARVAIEMMETRTGSAVAQGNFFQLINMDLNKVQQARAEFCIKGQDNILVEQDADLSGATRYETTGSFRIWDPVFPLLHTLYVKSCPIMGIADNAAILELRIPSWENDEKPPVGGEKSKRFVVFNYHLGLLLDKLMPMLKLTMLDSTGCPLNDMTSTCRLKSLYKHVASNASFAKVGFAKDMRSFVRRISMT